MSTLTWVILGAVGASVLWAFAVAWLFDVVAAQRKALNNAQVTLRLYRMTRDENDAQILALLSQNERLARQLIDSAAAATTCASRPTMTAWPVITRES
jgi:hypothetical protein